MYASQKAPPGIKNSIPYQVIVNTEDDTRFETEMAEPASNIPAKEKKLQNTGTDFEYANDGEFENSSMLTDGTLKDDFL